MVKDGQLYWSTMIKLKSKERRNTEDREQINEITNERKISSESAVSMRYKCVTLAQNFRHRKLWIDLITTLSRAHISDPSVTSVLYVSDGTRQIFNTKVERLGDGTLNLDEDVYRNGIEILRREAARDLQSDLISLRSVLFRLNEHNNGFNYIYISNDDVTEAKYFFFLLLTVIDVS